MTMQRVRHTRHSRQLNKVRQEEKLRMTDRKERFVLGQFDNELNRQQILHGSGAGVSFIDRSYFELPIRREHLSALGLSEGSAMYATMLIPQDVDRNSNLAGPGNSRSTEGSENLQQLAFPPYATLIASPVPPPAWNRGIRICFSTTESRTGQLSDLIHVLRRCGLLVRHTYAVNGLDSDRYRAVGAEGKLFSLDAKNRAPSEPSVVLTIEYMKRGTLAAEFDKKDGENSGSSNADEVPPKPAKASALTGRGSPAEWIKKKDENPDPYNPEERPSDPTNALELEVLEALHKYIEKWSSRDPEYAEALQFKGAFVKKLSDVLKKGVSSDDKSSKKTRTLNHFRIEWLSPLQTLQTLSSALGEEDSHQRPELTLRIRKSMADDRNLCISVEPWRRTLDPKARMSIEEAARPGRPNQCAVVTVDSEERTLTAHLVPIERFAVAQFEITHPAGRLQDFWKEWIYKEIKKPDGVVLQTFSQGRFDERWARELVVCYFPFLDEAESAKRGVPIASRNRLSKIAKCFKALQGITRNGKGGWLITDGDDDNMDGVHENMDFDFASKHLKTLVSQLKDHRKNRALQLMPDNFAGHEVLQRKDSTLRDVKLWYRWPAHATARAKDTYVARPFDFTQPLNFERYSSLYARQLFEQQSSRIRLVVRLMRLVAEDGAERSALLLGPYRSGKTSVLTMVRELLNSEVERKILLGLVKDEKLEKEVHEFFSKRNIVCIDINATVTPPHLLIIEIFRKLQELAARDASKLKDLSTKISNAVVVAFRNFFKAELTVNLDFPLAPIPNGPKLGLSLRRPTDETPKLPQVQLLEREQTSPWDSTEGRAAFLRGSLVVLRDALKQLGDNVKLVITLDEVAATAAWDNDIAFPVARF